jgi:hypothetical protein
MSTTAATAHVRLLPASGVGGGLREVVARRHGRRRNPARTTPRSSLRTPTNQLRRNPQRWLRKVGRSDANSETPHLYAAACARGHDHPRAIRTLGRGWCRIVWRCWQDRVTYDPARHRALQRHVTVTIPTSSGPVPDLAATQRMASAAVTEQAARRAERAALDGKPTSANTPGG